VEEVEEVVEEGEIGCPPYQAWEKRHPRSSSTCLSDPLGRDKVVVWEGGPKIALKKGAHLGPLNEGERARETRAAHPPSA
jgi:hypothetical protein